MEEAGAQLAVLFLHRGRSSVPLPLFIKMRLPRSRPLQHKTDPYSERQKQWQQIRRGR